MTIFIFILFLILLVGHVEGTEVGTQYDVGGLRRDLSDILDNALLNQNGSDTVKIGRGMYRYLHLRVSVFLVPFLNNSFITDIIAGMQGLDCTRDVLDRLTAECDSVVD